MTKRRARVAAAQVNLDTPIGDPYPDLEAEERRAWLDITGAAPPGVLACTDGPLLRCMAMNLASWRAGHCTSSVYEMYRSLREFLLDPSDIRRLLFPDRPRRRNLH